MIPHIRDVRGLKFDLLVGFLTIIISTAIILIAARQIPDFSWQTTVLQFGIGTGASFIARYVALKLKVFL